MSAQRPRAAPRLARGVRFQRLDDGSAVLLVPEGVVNLRASAASIAELIDGKRTADDIARELSREYDASQAVILADIEELLERFNRMTWLEPPVESL